MLGSWVLFSDCRSQLEKLASGFLGVWQNHSGGDSVALGIGFVCPHLLGSLSQPVLLWRWKIENKANGQHSERERKKILPLLAARREQVILHEMLKSETSSCFGLILWTLSSSLQDRSNAQWQVVSLLFFLLLSTCLLLCRDAVGFLTKASCAENLHII